MKLVDSSSFEPKSPIIPYLTIERIIDLVKPLDSSSVKIDIVIRDRKYLSLTDGRVIDRIVDSIQELGFFTNLFHSPCSDKCKSYTSRPLMISKNTFLLPIFIDQIIGWTAMTEEDVETIVKCESKYFNFNKSFVREKYKKYLTNSEFAVRIFRNPNGNILGYSRVTVTDKEHLISKYPNCELIFADLTGRVLYISEIVVLEKYQKLCVGSSILSTILSDASQYDIQDCVALSVKDGVNLIPKSSKMLENFKFTLLGEVPDAWNQSKDEVNWCPVCSKGNLTKCECSALVYTKKL